MTIPSARPTKIRVRPRSSGFSAIAPIAAAPAIPTAMPAPMAARPVEMAAASGAPEAGPAASCATASPPAKTNHDVRASASRLARAGRTGSLSIGTSCERERSEGDAPPLEEAAEELVVGEAQRLDPDDQALEPDDQRGPQLELQPASRHLGV